MIFVLTGSINSGKSTAIETLCRDLVVKGYVLSGLFTPALMVDGRKEGHNCVFIQKTSFADPVAYTRLYPFSGSFQWRRYHFNAAVFAAADTLQTDYDLFVIDEIGPLELKHHRGFWTLFQRALKHESPLLAVVRKQSLNDLQSLLGERDLKILQSTADLYCVEDFLRKQRKSQVSAKR